MNQIYNYNSNWELHLEQKKKNFLFKWQVLHLFQEGTMTGVIILSIQVLKIVTETSPLQSFKSQPHKLLQLNAKQTIFHRCPCE